jgi:indolepyruvate ferredoxin oxidoreductase
MAYKDEYEVARLYTDGDFLRRVADQFDGAYELRFHLAPPLLAERDPASGHLKKRVYGGWMLTAFRLLAGLRGLRGTPFDPFGRTAERRAERQLVADYEAVLDEIAAALSPANHAAAVELAALPLEIRGFGHIKEGNRRHAEEKRAGLLERFRSPPREALAAAE